MGLSWRFALSSKQQKHGMSLCWTLSDNLSTKSHVYHTHESKISCTVYVRCLDSVVIGYCSGIHAQCTSQVGIDECVTSHNLTRFSGTSCQTLAKHCNNPILKGASIRIWPRQEGPAACLTVSPHSPRKKQVVASFSSSTVDYKWVYNMDLLKEPPKNKQYSL